MGTGTQMSPHPAPIYLMKGMHVWGPRLDNDTLLSAGLSPSK